MDGWISQGEIRFLALKVFGIIEGYWVDGGFQIVRSLLRALDLVYHVPYVQNRYQSYQTPFVIFDYTKDFIRQ